MWYDKLTERGKREAASQQGGGLSRGRKGGKTLRGAARPAFGRREKGGRRLTVSQEKRERVLSAYFGGMQPGEIAAALRLKERTVLALLNDPSALELYKKRSEAAKLRAQICVNESAEEAAKLQARLLRGEEGTTGDSQRAARDILDRAGVCIPKEAKAEVTVRFVHGAPELGMPAGTEA